MKTAATRDHSQKAIAPVLRSADTPILDYSQKAIFKTLGEKTQIFFSIPTDLIAAVWCTPGCVRVHPQETNGCIELFCNPIHNRFYKFQWQIAQSTQTNDGP